MTNSLLITGNKENLEAVLDSPQVEFVHGNILEQKRIEQLVCDHSVDIIVHFAAESHVDRSILRPDAFIETNITGTHSLLKAARQVIHFPVVKLAQCF